MPKVKTTTISVVHKMEEKQVFPLSFLNDTPRDEGTLTSEQNLRKTVNRQDLSAAACVKSSIGQVIQFTGGIILYLIDFLITFCQSEWVRNIVVVFLTVSLEAFVVIVLAICTVLTTIIVNAEDAYKNCYGGSAPTIYDENATDHEVSENVRHRQEIKVRASRESDLDEGVKSATLVEVN